LFRSAVGDEEFTDLVSADNLLTISDMKAVFLMDHFGEKLERQQ